MRFSYNSARGKFSTMVCLIITSFIVLNFCLKVESSLMDSMSSFINSLSKQTDEKDDLHKVSKWDDLINLNPVNSQSFIQRQLFNSSVALTIPLISFMLPQRASLGSTVDLANQAIFGLFALLVTMMVFAVPVLFSGIKTSGGLGTGRDDSFGTQKILNRLMYSKPMFNLMGADLQHKIGLDSTKCLQKTICESHRSPHNRHYGFLALPFQIFFPPPENGISKSKISPFQMAASEGRYSTMECGKRFKCFFDILDLVTYFVDLYKYKTETNPDGG